LREQAARTPDAIAVVFEDEAITYHDLNRRANEFARRTRPQTPQPQWREDHAPPARHPSRHPHMHAHRLRHTLAHEWQLNHGNESDLMAIMGWRSPEMLRHYGKSAAAVRAQNSHRTMGLGNRV
jgi:non-ribosomal peptide synthetase component F